MHALLPSGGVLDRLGDAREKAREKARETLVILGGMAFRAGGSSIASGKGREGKGPETPLMIFERTLREQGFASKVWRVREQVSSSSVVLPPSFLFPMVVGAVLTDLLWALVTCNLRVMCGPYAPFRRS